MFKRKKNKEKSYRVKTKFEIEFINNYQSGFSENIKMVCDETVLITDSYYIFRKNAKNGLDKSINEHELRHYLFYRIPEVSGLRDEKGVLFKIKKPYITDIKILELKDID